MRRTHFKSIYFILLVVLALGLVGCQRNRPDTPEETPATEGVEADGSGSATIEITVPPATVTPLAQPEGEGQPTTAAIQPTATTPSSAGSGQAQTPGETDAAAESTDTASGAESSTESTDSSTSETSTVDESAAVSVPGSVSAGSDKVHVVKRGENLFRIALQYGMSYKTLARYNGIMNPDNIYAGQKIMIPANASGGNMGGGMRNTYVVKRGDTLSSIAARFNTSMQAIMAANQLSSPDLIYAGQTLMIP